MSVILVTGGAGFIGSHLSKALIEAGYRLRIIDNLSPQIHSALPEDLDFLKNPDIEFIRASIKDIEHLEGIFTNVKQIVHLASETGTGQSMYDMVSYSETNVSGTAAVLQALINNDNQVERFILASSRAVYGEGSYMCSNCLSDKRLFPISRTSSQLENQLWDLRCESCNFNLTPLPTEESDVKAPSSIYACTKLAQEDFVRVTCTSLGIDYALLRLQNVYGERQSLSNPYTGIISTFTNRALQGIDLLIYEDGQQSRDFIHISDLVNIICLAVNHKSKISRAINVGTGKKTSVEDLALLITKRVPLKVNLIYSNQYRLGDIRHNYADVTGLQATFRYSNFIDIENGLDRFFEWASQKQLPEDRLEKVNSEMIALGLMKAKS